MPSVSGYDLMPSIVAHATADIAAHLWSLYWLPRVIGARTIIELGVRSGDSTRAFLASVMDTRTPGALLWSYDEAGDAYRVQEVTEQKHGIHGLDFTKWSCHKSDSVAAAANWAAGAADLVFVDTGHSLELTTREIAAWYSKVRPGGAMVFHDTGLNEPDRDGVAPAMMNFYDSVGGHMWEIEDHPHVAEGDCGLGVLWRKAAS